MADLIYWALVIYGATYAITAASIFKRPRAVIHRVRGLGSLIECSTCTSFWVGALVATASILWQEWGPLWLDPMVYVVKAAFAAMALVNLVNWWPLQGEMATLSPVNREGNGDELDGIKR